MAEVEVKEEKDCPLCCKYDGEVPFKISWICCESCDRWYHNHCLKLSLKETSMIIKFHCPDCIPSKGPIEYRRSSGRKRMKIDYIALDNGEVENVLIEQHQHVNKFTEWSSDLKVEELKGSELTLEYALLTKLPTPVKIVNKEGLGMEIPKFDVDDLVESMGEDFHVEVMDVLTQNDSEKHWTLSEWRDYFKTKDHRERILNVLSLEISDSSLGRQIKRPNYVDEVDLVDKVWPLNLKGKPIVQKYCLMGVKDSFTDFHLDFAGTSVYYTIIYGSKEFIFFPPTEKNLLKYIKWLKGGSKEFLCDLKLEGGLKVSLQAGEALIIPSGWIHSVYTPVDTLVIGGNFLTFFNLMEQLKITKIESITKVEKKFKFPNFDKLMWLAAWKLINDSTIKGTDKENCSQLLEYLKQENQNVPVKIIGKPEKLIDSFERWISTTFD